MPRSDDGRRLACQAANRLAAAGRTDVLARAGLDGMGGCGAVRNSAGARRRSGAVGSPAAVDAARTAPLERARASGAAGAGPANFASAQSHSSAGVRGRLGKDLCAGGSQRRRRRWTQRRRRGWRMPREVHYSWRPRRYWLQYPKSLDFLGFPYHSRPSHGAGLDGRPEIRHRSQVAGWRIRGSGSGNAPNSAGGPFQARHPSRKQGTAGVCTGRG